MSDYQTPKRMALKEKAIPLPDLDGKTVLDIGCEHGHWCWLAARQGAKVTGIDRNRVMKDQYVDLIDRNTLWAEDNNLDCTFKHLELGKQWHDLGKHDVTFCFSVYHHIYQLCGDHSAVWFWLWRHTGEQLLWENPTSDADWVVKHNVDKPYLEADIISAAERYFTIEHIGPALHVPTREVWRCWPKRLAGRPLDAACVIGSGGAERAFEYAGGRRIAEIEHVLGVRCFPGSLNLKIKPDFDWNERYYRAQILDAVDRSNINGEWKPRWARFYPLKDAYAFRFEGETYKTDFVELIADRKLRDIYPETFTLAC